jgi:hypothetical protein
LIRIQKANEIKEYVTRRTQKSYLEEEANRVYYQADFAQKYLDPLYPNKVSDDPSNTFWDKPGLAAKLLFATVERKKKLGRESRHSLFYEILDKKEPKNPADAALLSQIFQLRVGINQRRVEISDALLDLSMAPEKAVEVADKALWNKVDPSIRGILATQTTISDYQKKARAILKSDSVPQELKQEVVRELDYLKKYQTKPHLFFLKYLEALSTYYSI